ncbi:OmpA family protein [Oceanomicrobium pacificus]|uniref:OmpA family protein n=1 Tax=Oceanomicrobium pacificus TaxID=2692916 RepID=A0A6B0TR88_9RHOB|nr:OmpA family protein [Oceanomicrobium pacificus]MXU66466.1 OmpA family protein [Oceanomicrobium pacificus]
MTYLRSSAAIALVATLGLSACTNPDGTKNNTGTGAAAGAAFGAAAGQIIGGDTGAAVVGGILGAAAGAAIGNNLDKQEAALRQQIGGSGATIVNTGEQLVVSLPEAITFDFDSAVLKSQFVPSVNAIARNLNEYPNTVVRVVGHTDSTGSASYNEQLSRQRAQSVANQLAAGGVSSSRLSVVGVGASQPIASNSTSAGRQQNRRVEIVIIPTR